MAKDWMDLYAPLIAAQGQPHQVTPHGGRNMAIAESKTEYNRDPWAAILQTLVKEGADYFSKDITNRNLGSDRKVGYEAMAEAFKKYNPTNGFEPSALKTGSLDTETLKKLLEAYYASGGK